jgi:hypothetical protein
MGSQTAETKKELAPARLRFDERPFISVKDESNIPILRMGAKAISGLMACPKPKRHNSEEPT